MRKLKDILNNVALSNDIMHKLIITTDYIGKLNTKVAKFHNPYILTYLLEGIDAINSNKIENIFSTIDEGTDQYIENNSASPYVRYREALKESHKRLITSGLIRPSDIEFINNYIRASKIGFRKTPVTIKDSKGTVMHTGINASEIPQAISDMLENLNGERTINKIVEALIIHHQFEYIHPFSDGNGRTGRILLSLMFYKFDILDIPASVISFSIYKNKQKYYDALKEADQGNYEIYLSVMLDMLIESLTITLGFADELTNRIKHIKAMEINISSKHLNDLIDYCFTGLKVSNRYLVKKLEINNKTVSRYIDELEKIGVMKKERNGKFTPYRNLIITELLSKFFNEN